MGLLGRARSVQRVKARKLKSFLFTLRDHFQIGNLLPILRVIKNLHGGSVVVETSSTCLKDGCHCLCYTTCGEVDVKISCSCFALVDFCSSLHKPFKADIAIASLAHVASSSIWNIPDVERVERHEPVGRIAGKGVTAVALVCSHLALLHEAEKALLRVDIRLGCRP